MTHRYLALLAASLAIALTFPGSAKAYTLRELLEMPFERVLELEITSRHAADSGAQPRSSSAAAGGRHAP
jgi:hypothetical protein